MRKIKSSISFLLVIIMCFSILFLQPTNTKATANTDFLGYQPIDLGENFVAYIRNTHTGKYFTNEFDNVVIANGVTGQDGRLDPSQQWHFTRQSDGSYCISNDNANKMLDVAGGIYENATNIQIYPANGLPPQKFFIYYINGNFYFRCHDSTKVVDANLQNNNVQLYGDDIGTDGAALARAFEIIEINVDYGNWNRNFGTGSTVYVRNVSSGKLMTANPFTWDVNFSDATYGNEQKWRLDRRADGSYVFISDFSGGLVLDVLNCSLDAGTTVNLYNNTNNKAQGFYILPMDQEDYCLIKPCYAPNVLSVDKNTQDLSIQKPNLSDSDTKQAQVFEIIFENIVENWLPPADLDDDFYAYVTNEATNNTLTQVDDGTLKATKTTFSENQLFHFVYDSVSNSYQIIGNSGKAITPFWGGYTDGIELLMADRSHNQNDLFQKFRIYDDFGSGYYYISPAHTNRLVDVDSNTGSKVQLFGTYGNSNRKFKLTIYNKENGKITGEETSLSLKDTSSFVKNGTYLFNVITKQTDKSVLSNFKNTFAKVYDTKGNPASDNSTVGTGYNVIVVVNGIKYDSATIIIKGDTNGDGVVDATDYLRIKSKFLETLTLNDAESKAADIDENQVIDSTDYLKIKSHFLGNIDIFKSEENDADYVNPNTWTDEYGATHNKTDFSNDSDKSMPYYYADFSKENCLSYFAYPNQIEYTFEKEGFVKFKTSGGDPYLCIETPSCLSLNMRYLRIEYRANKTTDAQIIVNRTDGISMGQNGSYFSFNFEKSDSFRTLILDINSICAKDVSFSTLRIDPATTSDVTVDIRLIAGFSSEEAAEKFDRKNYNENRIHLSGGTVWPDPVYVEQKTTALDNYEGTLKITDNKNGTVTISYVKNGEKVSYTVPDNVNYTSGGFSAVDDLNRSIPDSNMVGIYGENGEFYVGMFYFLLLGEHGDSGIYDINKIIAKYGVAAKYLSCGGWGGEYAMHLWGEPLYGYYFSRDEWVIRKHMELLSNANIDFLYFDVTNGFTYTHNAKKIMRVLHELNEQGYDAPKVVFYTNSSSANAVRNIYDEIYAKNYYPDTWFYVDGKPVIVAQESDNINNFFTIRLPQWPTEADNTNSWPWIDFKWPQRVYQNNNGVGESISVSVSQHSGSVCFSNSGLYGDTSNRGRSTVGASEAVSSNKVTADSYKYGNNFQAQWDRVFSCLKFAENNPAYNIKYVLVTGWNEWVAQRQPSIPGREVYFVDTFNSEYSRDLEMTRGLYFDNYYMQLIQNVLKLKGAAPIIIQDSRKAINVTGDFSQWDSVKVTYTDPKDDCNDRNETGFGNTTYKNNTGRNDIVSAKVTSDTKNLYFYVETAENISMFDTDSSWMQLFINVDGTNQNGWYGYDYIVNYKAKDAFTTTVAKNIAKGEYSFKTVGDVSYRVKGNQMMIAVPLEMLGIEDYSNVNVEFKWADSTIRISNMEAFYEVGDAAPLGRLNFIYRNK